MPPEGSLLDTGDVTQVADFSASVPVDAAAQLHVMPSSLSLAPLKCTTFRAPAACIRNSCSVHQTTSTPVWAAWSSCDSMLAVPSLNEECTCMAIVPRAQRVGLVGQRRRHQHRWRSDTADGPHGRQGQGALEEAPAGHVVPVLVPLGQAVGRLYWI